MGRKTKDDYVVPLDVRRALKTYPVTSPRFSQLLLKMRHENMSREDSLRAEKTLLSLKYGYPFK
jgi:hypothetical protein